MVDTVRTLAALQALLADNAAGDISEQDLRDMLVSSESPDWVRHLDHRLSGETSHADDDFFATDSSGDYTELDVSGTSTWTVSRGLLSAIVNGQSASDASAFLKAITSPSSPMTIEAAFQMRGPLEDSTTAAICFTDGVTSTDSVVSAVAFASSTATGYRTRGGTLTDLFVTVNNVVLAPSESWFNGMFYVRLAWTAANAFKAAWSLDGVTWTDGGEVADSFTMTPTHFGVYASSHSSSNDHLATFHYLRMATSDLVG